MPTLGLGCVKKDTLEIDEPLAKEIQIDEQLNHFPKESGNRCVAQTYCNIVIYSSLFNFLYSISVTHEVGHTLLLDQ